MVTKEQLLAMVNEKIETYNPRGGLAQTAKFFLALVGINHGETREHCERVALLAEVVAERMKKDKKAAFFAGLLHDTGKLVLPATLFEGHNISAEEYAQVKEHAVAGFRALRGLHSFTALCAGLHHNLYKAGYGLTLEDFPKEWGLATIKKVLDISAIISICDFIDAFTHRATKILDGSSGPDLRTMMTQKYPDDELLVDLALMANKKLGL